MKRRLSYIMACVALICATFTACIDDNIVDPDVPGNGTVKVSLRLVLPSGETPQTRAEEQVRNMETLTLIPYSRSISAIYGFLFSAKMKPAMSLCSTDSWRT